MSIVSFVVSFLCCRHITALPCVPLPALRVVVTTMWLAFYRCAKLTDKLELDKYFIEEQYGKCRQNCYSR